MSIFKRISCSIASQINNVVDEIENHDAVIKASIEDLKQKVAKAKVRKNNMSAQVCKIQKEIKSCESDVKLWQSRAVASASTDEQKALTCVSRAAYCEKEITPLTSSLQEYQNMELKLSQQIGCAEKSMSELIQKHDLMRARQSSSLALKATKALNEDSSSLLNDTFERWEIKLQQSELNNMGEPQNIDLFEQEFVQDEQAEDLKMALKALIKRNQGEE